MLIPASYRLLAVGAGLAIVAGGSAALTWQVQDWRYGQQLQQQARSHAETLNELTLASATMQRTEHDKRLALEQRLATSDQTHYRAMTDAQRDQNRLRDRLATADVRLSVLLDATASTGNCAVSATTPPAAWFMETYEPNLPQRMLNELSASPMTAIED